jgi:glucose-6-phosphate isomerase
MTPDGEVPLWLGPPGEPLATGVVAPGAGVAVQTRGIAASEAARQAAANLAAERVPESLAAGDTALWGPRAQQEAPARLGWLHAPRVSRNLLPEIEELAERARHDSLGHIVLAGIGDSSLAPEVITTTAGVPLTVLDTTDPHQVARALADRLEQTLVIVSSKTGTSVETDSHRRIYEDALTRLGVTREELTRRFVVVTDPGSPLDEAASEAGYHIVHADPDVSAGYSALTAFGLVPGGLAGADIGTLLADGEAAAATLPGPEGPGTALGAVLGGYALARHDKAVLADSGAGISGPGISGFGDWAEQLIAGSTGKEGRGILPVVVEDTEAPGFSPGPDSHLIALGEPASAAKPADTVVTGPVGAQFMVWEFGVALASHLLGISPFDQPDVAESREITAHLLGRANGPLPGGDPAFTDGAIEVFAEPDVLRGADNVAAVLDALLLALPDGLGGGYLAIMAYLDRIGDADAHRLRAALAARTIHQVTFGWGPRLLYSAGQYHKGGPQTGVFLQITGAITRDVDVPGRPYSLGRLQLAQALGDLDALRARSRPAIRMHLRDRARGIAQLIDAAMAGGTGES